MVHGAPQCWAFSSFDFEHHCIDFFFMLRILDPLDFFIPPSFVWAPSVIENFLLCPPVLFGHIQSLRFFLCLRVILGTFNH